MGSWIKTGKLEHYFEISEIFQPDNEENSELQSIKGCGNCVLTAEVPHEDLRIIKMLPQCSSNWGESAGWLKAVLNLSFIVVNHN